jgi:hypothetical protein
MPIPCHIKTERTAKARLEFMQRLSELAGPEVLSITQEVFADINVPAKMGAAAFHTYCNSLLNEGIEIPEGKYEPHPMYMRAYIRDVLITLQRFLRESMKDVGKFVPVEPKVALGD